MEAVPKMVTGDHIFYLPHKPVVEENASMTKVRTVLDATTKPHLLANSINQCMYNGLQLQPLLWDISIREHMSTHLVLVDIQNKFLQTGIREEDRDALWFQFNINSKEQYKVHESPHSERVPPISSNCPAHFF